MTMTIDAHNHFWKYNAVKHSWINSDMNVLEHDFLPADLLPLMQQAGMDGCIAVQAGESEEENVFLLEQANKYDFVKSVVGWIDMLSDSIEKQLQYYQLFEKMKGFRYVLQDKEDRALMRQASFKKNMALLPAYNFTYDILIYPDQLQYVAELVKLFPHQKFIINHIAKPSIKTNQINSWKKKINELGQFENLYCKLSGMVTEASWTTHTYDDFVPYMDAVLSSFGSKCLLFGSDWPVCTLASTYNNVVSIVKQFVADLSMNEQSDIMGNNAIQFYNL